MTNEILQTLKEAERAVLGACMQTVYDNPVADVVKIVTKDDFFTTDHQLIFGAIETLYQAEQPTTTIAVASQLKDDGFLNQLNRIGGADYLYELQAVIVETESTEHYAKIIREQSQRRKLSSVSSDLKNWAADDSLSVSEIYAKVYEKLETFNIPTNTLPSMTARELYDLDLPQVNWIVPSLIPDGLTVLAGDAKIGKSFFAFNIAIAVAMGGMALSNIEIEQPRNVTYLALEDPPALLQERLGLLTDGDLPNNLHIINDMHDVKFDVLGLKTLEQHIDKTKSELIVVDTWKHVAPPLNENGTAYDIDYKRFIPVQNFIHNRNLAMILITHTRKLADVDNPFNKIQGSMGVQAGCDTLLMMSRGSGGHILHVTGRRVVQDEYAISLSENGIWELEGRVNDVRKTETRQIIIGMLEDAGDEGLRATDIVTSSGRKENAVRLQLRRMLANGEIIQPSYRGKYYKKKS